MTEPSGQNDPILSQSMSGALLVSAILLLLSLVWALYDEFYSLRPWKVYQKRFVKIYQAYLEKAAAEQAAKEQQIRSSPEFQKLEQQTQEAETAAAPQVQKLDHEVKLFDHQVAALIDVFSAARGEVTALVYQAETHPGSKDRFLTRVEALKQSGYSARLPQADGSLQSVHYTYDELEAEYNRLKSEKSKRLAERVKILEPATTLRKRRDAYLEEKLGGLSEQKLRVIERGLGKFVAEIKQIHVTQTDLVDRCQSCHLGILEPVKLTADDMGGERVFVSHPNPELLRLHNPERFGCSPCHGGNGRAVSSVVKAHGRHKYWLWPMYYPENVEAGCQQCHAREMVLDHAEVLNHGKELFRSGGCIGCHRFEGFDDERERLIATRQRLDSLRAQRAARQLDIDRALTNEQAQNIQLSIARLDAESEVLRGRARSLLRQEKMVGPNLKEVRQKLRRDWIPVWLANPHEFRPTTKMPRFGVGPDGQTEEEWLEDLQAISAFLWQNALPASLPPQPRGDAVRGRELLMTRGCLACHAIGEGDQETGGRFAANLSRVGEKANYEYLVRWIHNPRERTRPYCPLEKRDLGPEDYAQHGLPFRFDREHSTCPNDGEELRYEQMTVMPNLRLAGQEVRDIATFLMTQRRLSPDQYPNAAFMDDKQLFDKGKFLARHYGCAGCHEMAGLEEEGRIGTDLTAEGSKPVDRLDFALFTHEAKNEGWYNHKGFFERKLANPAFYDQGKIRPELERLKMPKPNLSAEDIRALASFLLGSVEPGYGFPTDYYYRPEDQRRDIQEGWWIITKYNCIGCHQVRIGQKSTLMTFPQYQGEAKEQLPPVLIGAGARLNPDWLVRFLNNPALSDTDINRNGVRDYLKLRMPTFSLTDDEIQRLVRFFAAMSAQPEPYIPPRLAPLTDQELAAARQLFTHPASPCLKCHATGDPAHDRTVNAPNFLLVKERLKPTWTLRWILDPASIIPGVNMPSALFRRDGDRWVFSGPLPEAARAYRRDHAELLVRYMFQITPEEQRRLLGRLTSAAPVPARPDPDSVVKSH
ncbi:MAG: hypothetical protein ACRD35_04745 [Candidatus Acidiferrales bacterium]